MSESTNQIQSFKGLDPSCFYPLREACRLAGIGKNHMEQLKRKFKGNGIHTWGNDCGVYGRDLIKMFIDESQSESKRREENK
tara:strand:- start:241 stop:486 length:246 start_codon:yes stop_codon:yes gene_type:complete